MPLTEGSREKVKLRATFINNLAVGFFVAGFLAPILATKTGDDFTFKVVAGFLCIGMSLILHIYATRHMSELDGGN